MGVQFRGGGIGGPVRGAVRALGAELLAGGYTHA